MVVYGMVSQVLKPCWLQGASSNSVFPCGAAHYEDLDEEEARVKYMWQALDNFSNEDRSRFLRFVTGRRRMPAPLYICPDRG